MLRVVGSFLPNVTADRILQWAATAVAPTVLPDLVRRLLLATASLDHLNVSAGTGTWQPGFDGAASVREPGPFWPAGASVWEFSVSENVRRKADADFKKRTTDPLGIDPSQTTYVAVTARQFPQKAEWAAQHSKAGAWRAVQMLDGEDLVSWLVLAPAIAVWFAAEHLGIPATDITDVRSYLRAWSQRTVPALPSRLALSRRDEALKAFTDAVGTEIRQIRISADTLEEAALFAAAALVEGERVAQQTIVVESEAALRWAVRQAQTFDTVVLPTFTPTGVVDGGASATLIVPLSAEAAAPNVDVTLGRVSKRAMAEALEKGGLPPERARRLAQESGGQLLALQRLLGFGHPTRPEWARGEGNRELMTMLLVGAFMPTAVGDRRVLNELGSAPEQVEELCSRLQHSNGTPIVRKGDVFTWASIQDAWNLLSRELTATQLDAFLRTAEDVLGVDEAKFEVALDERFYVSLRGQEGQPSRALRAALTLSLARLAHSPEIAARRRTSRTVERVVHAVLIPDWKRWASLSEVLPNLAEAAPRIFLDRLDESIQYGSAGVSRLFLEEGAYSNVHTGLLWALERLAWTDECVSETVAALAQLAALDPGGKWANRPARSLREILHDRLPQSRTTVAQRVGMMAAIARKHEDVAWSLGASAISPMGMVHPHAHPDFLTISPTDRAEVTRDEIKEQRAATVQMLLGLAGASADRWSLLVERLATLLPSERDAILAQLRTVAFADPLPLWGKIRRALRFARRRERAGQGDRMLVEELTELYKRFTPVDPVLSVAWLFGPEVAIDDDDGFEQGTKNAAKAQTEALDRILQEDDWLSLVQKLCEAAPNEALIGRLLADSSRADEMERELFSPGGAAYANILPTFLANRSTAKGLPWFLDRLDTLVGNDRLTEAAGAARCHREGALLWEGLDRIPSLAKAYWQTARFWTLENSEWATAITRLIAVGRFAMAVEVAETAGEHASTGIAFGALIKLAERASLVGAAGQEDVEVDLLQYHIDRLLARVSQDPVVDTGELAKVSLSLWLSFPSDQLPSTVIVGLENSTEMFVALVSLMYRADDEAGDATPNSAEQIAAYNASRVLESWHGYPGRGLPPDEQEAALFDWSESVLSELESAKRIDPACFQLAEVLARVPNGSDGIWPCVAARRLLERGKYHRLRHALQVAKYNVRGVYSKALGEGGAQELSMAERFTEWAREVQNEWPASATMLREMAQSIGDDSAAEDERAQVVRDDYDIESPPRVEADRLDDVETTLRTELSLLPTEVSRLAYIRDADPGGATTLVVYMVLKERHSTVEKRNLEKQLRAALGVLPLPDSQGIYFRWRTEAEHDQLIRSSQARKPIELRR